MVLTVICNCNSKYAMTGENREDGVTGECRSAAIRAYSGLRSRGLGEMVAFDASVRVYRHYHPGSTADRARDLVAHWIEEDIGSAVPVPAGTGPSTVIQDGGARTETGRLGGRDRDAPATPLT